jgi:uncharacterized protein
MSRETFTFRSVFNCSVERLFAWHARPGAFLRLNPPWDPVRLRSGATGITDGNRVRIALSMGGISIPWELEHLGYRENEQFQDRQISGPFCYWLHSHRFLPLAEDRCELEEHIEYELPFGRLGSLVAGSFTKARLDQLFSYRHRLTALDIDAHETFGKKRLSLGISGASGLVGSTLKPFLTTGGHSVKLLVRKRPESDSDIYWDPERKSLDQSALEGLDSFVHLSGENIASGPWTTEKKRRIRDSRVKTTSFLCQTLSRLKSPPRVLISASAVGFYGDRGEEELTEISSRGKGFLAEVCEEWEEATRPASDSGIRVVNIRMGIVLSASGGALKTMLPPFRFGLGGSLGSGKHFMSWIALQDIVRLIYFSLQKEEIVGSVNACSPNPVRNVQFTKTLGKVLRRRTLFPVPATLLKATLPGLAHEALLSSQRVLPQKVLDHGFSFSFPQLDNALSFTLGLSE